MALLREMNVRVGDVVLYADLWKKTDPRHIDPQIPCVIIAINTAKSPSTSRSFTLKQLFKSSTYDRLGDYEATLIGHIDDISGFVSE